MKIELDQETADALEEIAALNNMEPQTVIAQSMQNPATVRYWRERAEDKASLEAMENGDFLSQEEMESKMDALIKKARDLKSHS